MVFSILDVDNSIWVQEIITPLKRECAEGLVKLRLST